MNNLVKQQGCAGSGVTSFTPHWQAFLLSKRGGSRNQNLSPLKRRPHITYLCSPVCLSCPPLPRATEFPFLLLFNHRQHCIFPVNGHHDRGGCRALCPGKAVLHAASVTSYLSWMQDIRKEKKKQNLFCRREWQDKQITRKWETASFHDILRSATAMSSHQLRHPRDASTWFLKGSCMHHSGTVISHSSGGSLHPHTIKKKTKTTHQSGSFPSEQMTKLFCSFFFSFFLFWTGICSRVETNSTSLSWDTVFPQMNTVLYKRSFIWRVTKHCSFSCRDRDIRFYAERAPYASEGFAVGPPLAAEKQSGTTTSRRSRQQVFLITIHSNVLSYC